MFASYVQVDSLGGALAAMRDDVATLTQENTSLALQIASCEEGPHTVPRVTLQCTVHCLPLTAVHCVWHLPNMVQVRRGLGAWSSYRRPSPKPEA